MKNIYFFFIFIPGLLNAQWTQVSNDIYGKPGDAFGPIISVMNSQANRIAVANAFSDTGKPNAGHVRVYDLIGDEWVQVGPDLQGNVYSSEAFGISVDINASGQYIAVGIGESGVGEGRASVYEYDGSSWLLIGLAIEGESTGDDLGTAISLSDDGQTLAVSAPGDDGNGTSAGQVRVYQFQNGNWIQIGQDINGFPNDELGNAISLNSNGDILAIAANVAKTVNGSYTGKVIIYKNQNGVWVQLGSDINGSNFGDRLGSSIDLNASGNRLVVGVIGKDDVGADNKGAVHIYEYDGNDWNLLGEEILGKIRLNGFGNAVGINDVGDTIIVGAPYSDPNNPYEGEAWLYKYGGQQWEQYGTSLVGTEIGDVLGVSVCISSIGDYVAVASGGSDLNPGDDAGKVSVYNIESLLGNHEQNKTIISLYPNPTNNFLFLQSPYENITKVTIYSMLGNVLQQLHWRNGKQDMTIDMKNFTSGSYFIEVTSKTHSIVKKIVKY